MFVGRPLFGSRCKFCLANPESYRTTFRIHAMSSAFCLPSNSWSRTGPRLFLDRSSRRFIVDRGVMWVEWTRCFLHTLPFVYWNIERFVFRISESMDLASWSTKSYLEVHRLLQFSLKLVTAPSTATFPFGHFNQNFNGSSGLYCQWYHEPITYWRTRWYRPFTLTVTRFEVILRCCDHCL